LTEHELIEGCVKNNANCQRMLFEQYAGLMMTICLRYSRDCTEAEDMLQEGFIRVFRYINQYKFEGSFEGWLKRIIVNASLRILQKKGIHFSEINEELKDLQQADADVLSNLSEGEILKLISNLPPGYRVVFNMYVMEGYSHIEIAEMLKINTGTCRSQLAKAKRTLQEQIRSQQKLQIDE
jgi:RNA polymerase sigma-70 factor (ECF subfamily)